MKYEDLPEFARPYKKKGYDVRKRKDTFFLYRITSRRVEGKKNPQLVQEYIGIINPESLLTAAKDMAAATDLRKGSVTTNG